MSDFADRIRRTLAEIERTKGMADSPDRVAVYPDPIYTSLVRDIVEEIKKEIKEEALRELKKSG